MSVYKMATTIFEDTTSDNIAFLPVDLLKVKPVIVGMARKKRNGHMKIHVLEHGDRYIVSLDDYKVGVEKSYWPEFRKMLGTCTNENNEMTVSMWPMLREAKHEIMARDYDELSNSFRGIFKADVVKVLKDNYDAFVKYFGAIKKVTDANVMVPIEIDKDVISKRIKQIRSVYGDSIGNIEMMASAMDDRSALGRFDVFNKYSYLIGARVYGQKYHVRIMYECAVDMNFVPSEKIIIHDSEILDAVDELGIVHVTKGEIYPKGKYFDKKVFNTIKGELGGKDVKGDDGSKDTKGIDGSKGSGNV